MRCRLAVAALALGLLAAATGCSSSSTNGAAKDVSITGCNADPGGGRPRADGQVINHSSKASTYAISVVFQDASGNHVSIGAAAVGRVAPGATATWHSTGAAGAKGPLHCTVSVTRTVAL